MPGHARFCPDVFLAQKNRGVTVEDSMCSDAEKLDQKAISTSNLAKIYPSEKDRFEPRGPGDWREAGCGFYEVDWGFADITYTNYNL